MLVAGLIAAAFAAGLVGVAAWARGWHPRPRRSRRKRFSSRDARRAAIAAGAGLVVGVATRWPVAAIATAAVVWVWPAIAGGGAHARRDIARVEGLATWTESVRDTVAATTGLEQAIPSTVDAAAPVLQPYLRRLAGMLGARVPLPEALARFGHELADPTADQVVAALISNARLRGPGLRDTLSGLAVTTREELELRRRIEAERQKLRWATHAVVTITVLISVAIAVFAPRFVEPYKSAEGQAWLAFIIAIAVAALVWLRRLDPIPKPRRFLASTERLASLGGSR